jgi:hypothetical protein
MGEFYFVWVPLKVSERHEFCLIQMLTYMGTWHELTRQN